MKTPEGDFSIHASIKGIDTVLKGFEHSQKEIKFLVDKCQENENKNGYLVQDFFIHLSKYFAVNFLDNGSGPIFCI